ncbi:DUF485 domain-containing protein [Novipirellula artificiosorum]|uniref:DUF485 domain-containing protein n=1 Tax=Novipirellula artificiosorum TaxID=2528016 RepID=A0A5C6DK44_9BACT|nr:DUF485 domain-containing protein [Novipirellula artificiosorum]TWU37108.1 hypothetical protein Poly41_32350 [Novipirellula artificiosorum]
MTNPSPPRDPEVQAYNLRVGLILFFVYSLLYVGFVLLNAIKPSIMETIVLAGLNLAIVYGFGLILAAIVMALLYGFLCRTESSVSASQSEVSDE